MLDVRHVHEPKRYERVKNTGGQSGGKTSCETAAEEVRREPAERESREHRHVVRGDRAGPEHPQRKEQHRQPVQMFAERQRILRRMKRIRVEEMQRLVQRRPPIPVENPDVDEWIPGIGGCPAEVRSERPGEGHAQDDEDRRGKSIAETGHAVPVERDAVTTEAIVSVAGMRRCASRRSAATFASSSMCQLVTANVMA